MIFFKTNFFYKTLLPDPSAPTTPNRCRHSGIFALILYRYLLFEIQVKQPNHNNGTKMPTQKRQKLNARLYLDGSMQMWVDAEDSLEIS